MAKKIFEKILGVDPKTKVFGLFILNANTPMHITDIGKHADVSRPTLYKMLFQLKDLGIIKIVKKKGMMRYFALNPANPVVDELIALYEVIRNFYK